MIKTIRKIWLTLFALCPSLALAENLFDVPETDKSLTILRAIFGQLGDVFGASSSDALAPIMRTYVGGALIIGGLLVAYTIIVGTLGTAHDGEMLGKKFSSVWIPIRTSLGSALTMPVINGSYCTMQYIVAWLIVQGIGFADTTWNTWTASDNLSKEVQIGFENPNVTSLAANIATSLICMKGYQKIYNDTSNANPEIFLPLAFKTTTVNTDKGAIIKFGAEGSGFSENSCGQVEIENNDHISGISVTSNISLIGNLDSVNASIDSANSMHLRAVENLIKTLSGSAENFANGGSIDDLKKAISNAGIEYSNEVKTLTAPIIAQLGNFEQIQKESKKNGWFMAGGWQVRFNSLYETASQLKSKVPSSTGVAGTVNNNFDDQFNKFYSRKIADLKELSKDMTEVGIPSSVEQSTSETGWLSALKNGLGANTLIKKAFRATAMPIVASNENVFMGFKKIGNYLAETAGAMYLTYSSLLTVAGTSQGTGIALAVATLPLALAIFPTLIGLAVLLSYVLPMLPFMIWLGACMGWLIMACEAIIAAPIWAVMHLSPNGDDMVGTAGQGYRLVLGLMLRPVLMVFGLIMSFVITTLMGQFVNQIFFDVFILSQQNSNFMIMIIGIIASPLLYLMVQWTIVQQGLKLIYLIPDELLKWFGGGGQQLGNFGQAMGGSQAQQMLAGAVAGGAGGGLLGKGLELKKQSLELTRENQALRNTMENSMNKDLGSNGSDIVSKGLANAGKDMKDPNTLNSFEGQKMRFAVDSANNVLGGPNTSHAENYRENLENNLDKGMQFNEAHQQAYGDALDEKFGAGTAQFLLKSSTDGNYAGSGFAKGVEQVNAVHDYYQAKGLSEVDIKNKIGGSLKVVENYADKNQIPIGDAMDGALTKIFKPKK